MTFIFGSGLDEYLLSKLFRVDNSAAGEDTLTSIKQRQPLRVRAGLCCLGKRTPQSKLLMKGLDRIEREQDFVRYIKKQMMIDTVFEVLFTKVDRFLLKN